MSIAAKGYLGTGATGGTVGAVVFAPATGKTIRVTGILFSAGATSGTVSLLISDGLTDYVVINALPVTAGDTIDATVLRPVNILDGWTLKISMSEGITVNVSGEEM